MIINSSKTNLFYLSSSLTTKISLFKVKYWEYQGSNPGPCILHAMSLPYQPSYTHGDKTNLTLSTLE
jgi:hypothetical protein